MYLLFHQQQIYCVQTMNICYSMFLQRLFLFGFIILKLAQNLKAIPNGFSFFYSVR